MFNAKFVCPSMHSAYEMFLSTQKYSVHANWLVCLILAMYVVPSSINGIQMFHIKFGILGMYTELHPDQLKP